MEQTKNRLQRAINYMKKPEFLLLLGLVNLLLIVCIGSRLHKTMYFGRMGMNGGYSQSHMMNKSSHRGSRGGYNNQQGRGMMNNPQANPEPMPQPEAQSETTQSTGTVQ